MDALIHRTELGMDRRPGMETPVRSAISLVACALLSCSALFLVVRLSMDRFQYRLENHALLMVVFTLCIFSFFCRYNYLRSDLIYRGLFPGMHVWLDYGPVVAVFCCFIVLTISGMPGVWLGAGTAGLMIVEWMLRSPSSTRLSWIFQKPNKADSGVSTSEAFQPGRLKTKPVKSIRTQQQRHRKLDNGQECWEGWIRIRVPANTRHLVEHISFCPSLLIVSGLSLEPLSRTIILLGIPTCIAANPIPGAAYIVSNISFISFCISSSTFSTTKDFVLKSLFGSVKISLKAM